MIMITESELVTFAELVNTNQRLVELAMIILHDRTTGTEEARRRVEVGDQDRLGFCDYYMKLGERLARRVWEGHSLTGDDLIQAQKIATHHRSQVINALKASHFLGF